MTFVPQDFIDDEAREDFIEVGHVKLEAMADALAKGDGDGFAALLRDLHSLKGNAQVFGFSEISNLCHRFEEVLAGQAGFSDSSRQAAAIYLAHIEAALQQLCGR